MAGLRRSNLILSGRELLRRDLFLLEHHGFKVPEEMYSRECISLSVNEFRFLSALPRNYTNGAN